MQPWMFLVAFGRQPWEMAYPFHGPVGFANGQGGESKQSRDLSRLEGC